MTLIQLRMLKKIELISYSRTIQTLGPSITKAIACLYHKDITDKLTKAEFELLIISYNKFFTLHERTIGDI